MMGCSRVELAAGAEASEGKVSANVMHVLKPQLSFELDKCPMKPNMKAGQVGRDTRASKSSVGGT